MAPLKYQIDRMRFRAAISSSIVMMKDENFHQNKVARVVTGKYTFWNPLWRRPPENGADHSPAAA